MANLRQLVPVSQAARQLKVSAPRVRQLARSGQLRAVKPGRELLVDLSSLQRRQQVVRPSRGRPLSPRMAWALLWLVSDGRVVPWVSASEMVRLRRYAQARPASQWPKLLARRAAEYSVRMLPGPLSRLRDDENVAAGGVSAAAQYGLDLMPSGSEAELYVSAERFDELRHDRRLSFDPDEPNLRLRVSHYDRGLIFDRNEQAQGYVPPAAVAADLLEAGDERSERAAHQLLATLHGPR